MSRVIGIDLGTTNSAVAVMDGGTPFVIANAEGNRTTPSVVHFGADGEVVVGDLAKRMLIPEPRRTIRSIKRFMGLRYSETAEQRMGVHYDVEPTERDDVRVVIGNQTYTPEAISAEVLRKMRESAEDYLGERVEHAVITVPAYFNDTQRQATKLAGELAGLDVLRIINEPTAACLAYGIDLKRPEHIVVFDLGGGTFDISLLEIDNGVFEVKATCGDNTLGGDTLDALFAAFIEAELRARHGLDVARDPKARQRVLETAEKVKCELSTLASSSINLPFIGIVDDQPVHYQREITRAEFEEIIRPALARIEAPCEQALADGGWKRDSISKVLLVGGSTRIPAVRAICQEIFRRPPSHDVNPDEAVAVGAAIQGSVITGGLAEVLLLDVTPLSLGLSSAGGVFNVLVPRNSTIPTEAHRAFTTTRDYQRSVRIAVYQGERKVAAENRLLAQFRLEDISPAPKGVPQIDVNFRIDANGILNVSATDISTGVRQEVRIDSFMATKDESERMLRQAEESSDRDRQFLQRTALHMRAARLQEAVEMLLREFGKSIETGELKEMKELCVKIDVAFYTGDIPTLEDAVMRLAGLADQQGDNYLTVKTRLGMA